MSNTFTYKMVDRVAEQEYQERLQKLFIKFCDEVVLPVAVNSSTFGQGKIIDIKGKTVLSAYYQTVFDSGEEKVFILPKATHLTIADPQMTELFARYFTAQAELDAEWNQHCIDYENRYLEGVKQRQEAENAARQAKRDADEAEKQRLKFEEQKKRIIANFTVYGNTYKSIEPTKDFWYSLGWLAKYVGTVTASLPDYLDEAFSKRFGSDTPRHLIDATKKTTGGYSMKWDWSFKLSIKKNRSQIPISLLEYISESTSYISNTAFIWSLIEDYNFQFGKEQNIDLIRSNIPAEYLESFEQGFES